MRSISPKALAASLGTQRLLVFLDLDGTLAQIALRPQMVHIAPHIRSLLRQLARTCDVVIVSGRSLSDAKKKIGVRSIGYAGNHGLEWELHGTAGSIRVPPEKKRAVRRALSHLRNLAREHHGALVEDKELSLSFHVRAVNVAMQGRALASARAALAGESAAGRIRLTDGKKVLEVRPAIAWDKGKFVRMARRLVFSHGSGAVVYIGDDATDEDAFGALQSANTIRVGHAKRSAARYYFSDRKKVETFLRALIAERH